MPNTAIAEHAGQMPANVEQHPATDSGSLLAIISRAASDPAVDIDKMERLMQMHERLVARDAEAAFNKAMMQAQSEMGRIGADRTNTQTKSKYATYAKLDAALRPIYTRHGFALSFDTGRDAPDGMVRVVAYVSHGGFTRSYSVDMPADGKGAKGGDVMTKTHATGAAMSYGMRYLLKMIFNVAVGEDDRDGNEVQEAPNTINEAQLNELLDLIDRAETTPEKFCAVGRIEAVADVAAKDFASAKAMLLDRIKKLEKRTAPKVDLNAKFDQMERGQ